MGAARRAAVDDLETAELIVPPLSRAPVKTLTTPLLRTWSPSASPAERICAPPLPIVVLVAMASLLRTVWMPPASTKRAARLGAVAQVLRAAADHRIDGHAVVQQILRARRCRSCCRYRCRH